MQHLLPLGYPPGHQFEHFLATVNAAAVVALKDWLGGKRSRIFYLSGRSGSGKSHLLHASHLRSHEAGQRVAFIDLANTRDLEPEILQAYASLDLICLDSMEAVCGNRLWENAIFNLINESKPGRNRILIAGQPHPDGLALNLPDLRSRLGWDLVFRLATETDEDKHRILIAHAARLGLKLNKRSADYLMSHYSRNLKSLVSFLEALDKRALLEKRKPGVALIKAVMREGLGEKSEE